MNQKKLVAIPNIKTEDNGKIPASMETAFRKLKNQVPDEKYMLMGYEVKNTINKNGEEVRNYFVDYTKIIQAINILAEDKTDEIIVICQFFNFIPAPDHATPGTYYNAMGNFNTSKEDYEAARPWAETATFIERGKAKNPKENLANKLASDVFQHKNVMVYIQEAGKPGLINATEVLRTKAEDKVDPNLKFLGFAITEIWNLESLGLGGTITNEYFEFEMPATILDEDVSRCPHCGQFIRIHQESERKPWLTKEVDIVDPYDTAFIMRCPNSECKAELTRANLEDGRAHVKALQDKEYYAKKRQLDLKNKIKVSRGEMNKYPHIDTKWELIPRKDDEHVSSPVITVDPATVTPKEKYVYKRTDLPHIPHVPYVAWKNPERDYRKAEPKQRIKLPPLSELKAEMVAARTSYKEALRKRRTPELFTMTQVLLDFEHKCMVEGKYKKSFWTRTHYMFISK